MRLFALLLLVAAGLSAAAQDTQDAPKPTINWYTWEEAVALNEANPKKIFVDVYTDWCGWCKRMDASTFKNPVIVALMNEYFYPVKLDAEMKEDVTFRDHTFKYQPNGRRGVHELAVSLLDGKMGYPSFVLLDEEVNRFEVLSGFQSVSQLEMVLTYYGKSIYKTQEPAEFRESFKSEAEQAD